VATKSDFGRELSDASVIGDSLARPERRWLFGISSNLLRNELRSEQRALRALARVASEPGHGDTDAATLESTDLPDVLAALDADQRDVLLLYAWEGLSYREVAVALGVPVGTIRSRLARARARLRAGREACVARRDQQEVTNEHRARSGQRATPGRPIANVSRPGGCA
jgi:hypothetical protein